MFGSYSENVKYGFLLIQNLKLVLNCVKLSVNFILLMMKLKKQYWIKEFWTGFEKHKDFLNEKSFEWKLEDFWYTHKMVKDVFLLSERL